MSPAEMQEVAHMLEQRDEARAELERTRERLEGALADLKRSTDAIVQARWLGDVAAMQRDEARKELEEARAELERTRKELEEVRAVLANQVTDLVRIRKEHEGASRNAGRFVEQRDEARKELEEARAELERTRKEHEAAKDAHEAERLSFESSRKAFDANILRLTESLSLHMQGRSVAISQVYGTAYKAAFDAVRAAGYIGPGDALDIRIEILGFEK